MSNIEKALKYFKSRKAMLLADQVQIYEDVAIEALEKQLNDGWIPTSERLPNNEERIVLQKNGSVLDKWFSVSLRDNNRVFTAMYDGGEWSCPFTGEIYGNVTAWQPLSEPYKEGK